jgi:hypothetical protein
VRPSRARWRWRHKATVRTPAKTSANLFHRWLSIIFMMRFLPFDGIYFVVFADGVI